MTYEQIFIFTLLAALLGMLVAEMGDSTEAGPSSAAPDKTPAVSD